MKVRVVALGLVALVTVGLNLNAFAGANDFFGSNVGGNNDSAQGSAAVSPVATSAPPGDYTVDEKRMQKKYKANLKAAKALVAKADKMSKDADKKIATKGKILKEIGEKRLNELNTNNPFPEIAGREPKKVQ